MSKLIRACFLFMGLLFVATLANAQSSGTITGVVKDATGAIIPNATVTAHSASTNVDTERTTNASGVYVLVLPAGDYRVEAKASGFQSVVHEKVTIDALASVALDLSLAVGTSNQEITVTAASDTIQTDNVELGSTIRNEVYAALPLQMSQGVPRDPTSFVGLAPGVAAVVLQSAGPSYTSFNGGQQEVNGLYFEGLPISFPNQMGDTRPLALAVSVDAVNQFQVEINGEKAEYQGQGFHNYVIKSGADKFHGGIFEYFRNTAFDAKNYFFNSRTPVPPDHQNEYGGNFSGPIIKGKLFFFVNYDAYDFNTTTASTVLSLPDAKERAGNFSELPTQLYDPTTQTCTPACTKKAYSGTGAAESGQTAQNDPLYNVIPANEISALAGPGQSLASYLPATNITSATPYINNYLDPIKRSISDKNITARVDYNMSAKQQIYGVFAYGKWATDYTGNLTPTSTALPLPYTASPGIVTERPLIAQIHDTYTITPSLLNTIGVGVVRLSIPITQITQYGNFPQKAGLTGLPGSGEAAKGFPAINFAGNNAPSSWGSTGPFNEWENDVMGQDSLEWVKGKHIFKFGFTYQSTQDNRASPTDGTSATFNFAVNETSGWKAGTAPGTTTLDTTTGNAYASYLLGAIDSQTISNNKIIETGSRFHNYSVFAQDDWKITPKFTVNLGMRWDVFSPFGEEHNLYSFAVPSLANPAAGGVGGALVYSQGLVPTHYKNFQPRIGLAYQVDDKTVVRAGFLVANTLGTLGIGGNGPNGPGQNGFNPPSLIQSATTGQPAYYWANGVQLAQSPFPLLSSGFGAGNSTTNPTGAIAAPILANPSLASRSPQYINWSFGIQRQMPLGFTLGLTYSASVGHFLSRYTAVGPYNNSMNPKYLALGSLLTQQENATTLAAAQAAFPEIKVPFANFQGTIATMLEPFPQYAGAINSGTGTGGTTCYSCDEGASNYNSLQATIERKIAGGLTTQIAYTYGKEIDDLSGTASQLGAVPGGTRNPYDHTLDHGLGVIDHRHNLHISAVYNIPLGPLGANHYVKSVIGGWQVSAIYSFETGMPLGITGTGCNVPGIVSTCMVSLAPGYSGSAVLSAVGSGNAHTGIYLDKHAFVDPAAYTFGNEPRSAPYGLYAPTTWEVDSTLRKTIPIHDSINFQLAADFFNTLNNVVFAAPATNIDSATFGTVTSTQNLPRHIQFSGKINF
jgi:hypothetical protein